MADDWIQTTDVWNWKRPLYQLSHNHYPVSQHPRLWNYSRPLRRHALYMEVNIDRGKQGTESAQSGITVTGAYNIKCLFLQYSSESIDTHWFRLRPVIPASTENTYCSGKYHCIAGLQFYWYRFKHFTTYKLQHIFLFGRIRSSHTGDQLYRDTCPLVGSVFWPSFAAPVLYDSTPDQCDQRLE